MKAIAAVKGKIEAMEIDRPALPAGHVGIRTEYSAISPGTEMTALRRGSEQPVWLGYSAVGIVDEVGESVVGRAKGQRVACYGAPYVRHAEWLAVPSNLTAIVPEPVLPEAAALAGLGAIAIHALRVADLRFGETVAVVGLGILGQLIARIASAAAIRAAGLDIQPERASLLRRSSAVQAFVEPDALTEHLRETTDGLGADSVLLCASGHGEELINRSFEWIRDRGSIVVVGDLTAEFSRALMFGKEAKVLISRAGGPGRYDPGYERDNRDYPIGYVRWTEGRNVEEFIRLLGERRIDVETLISGIYPIAEAHRAYESYAQGTAGIMGTLVRYGS